MLDLGYSQVSMPWRAFGDSEEDVLRFLGEIEGIVSMPWRAFGDSEGDLWLLVARP